jgi:pyridoxal 5'-phosphate synthase pdxS subunit
MAMENSTLTTKKGLAQMLKGGGIRDVVPAQQAKIAEAAGASPMMALRRVSADSRQKGGVARVSDSGVVTSIADVGIIPVLAEGRSGHLPEARSLAATGIGCIDESEARTAADDCYQVNQHDFNAPLVCGCRGLGEALRRIGEGAARIGAKGRAGAGAVVNFAAGSMAPPADAARMMALGATGVFVGSGARKRGDPERCVGAITQAAPSWDNPRILAEVRCDSGALMRGINIATLPRAGFLSGRGS